MARQFNGTNEYLLSASALTAITTTQSVFSVWLWIDAFDTAGDPAFHVGAATGNGHFQWNPNHSTGNFLIGHRGNVNLNTILMARPSAAAWHHIVANHDLTVALNEIPTVWVDGVMLTIGSGLTQSATNNNASMTVTTQLLYVMRDSSSFRTAGRIAEIAIWTGINFVQADVDALYSGGAGALATSVQNSNLSYYWRILGTTAPEPPTTGGINLDVTGTTQVAHPFTLAAGLPIGPRELTGGTVAKRTMLKGATSRIEYIWVQDSSSAVGAGRTGLAWDSAGLSAYYVRPGGSATVIALATQTVTGAYTAGGFVEISNANMPGLYRFDPPDACWATGVDKVLIELKGATNMVPVPLEYQLVDVDPEDVAQARAIAGIVIGTASGGSTTSITTSSLTPAATVADQYKGAVVIFSKATTTAALRGQRTTITTSTSGGVLTVIAMTTAPASGDTFVIV